MNSNNREIEYFTLSQASLFPAPTKTLDSKPDKSLFEKNLPAMGILVGAMTILPLALTLINPVVGIGALVCNWGLLAYAYVRRYCISLA